MTLTAVGPVTLPLIPLPSPCHRLLELVRDGVICTRSSRVLAALRARFGAAGSDFATCFPRLALSANEFDTAFGGYAELAPLLADASSALMRVPWLLESLGELDAMPGLPVPRVLVHALLFAASVQPMVLREQPLNTYSPYECDMWVHSALQRTLTPRLLRGALLSLLSDKVGECDSFFSSVLPNPSDRSDAHCLALTLPRRLLLLNLLTCEPALRSRIRSSPLFERLLVTPWLSVWLRARWEGSVEQRYLNSCEISAQLATLCASHATLASHVAIAHSLLKMAKERFSRLPASTLARPAYRAMWSSTAPSLSSFVNSELVHCERSLSSLESRALSLCALSASEPRLSALQSLLSELHSTIQRLSGVWRADSPRFLTPVLLSSRWHASALLMTASAIVTQVLPWQPHMLARLFASSHLGHTSVISQHAQSWFLPPAYARSLTAQLRSESLSASASDSLVAELWWALFDLGGTHFITEELVWGFWSVGHVSLLLAVPVPTDFLPQGDLDFELRFLVCDPETRWSRLLRPSQLIALIRNRELKFCFEDASFGGTV